MLIKAGIHELPPIPYAWPKPMPRGMPFLLGVLCEKARDAFYHLFQACVNKKEGQKNVLDFSARYEQLVLDFGPG
jgi:hypothetical protein